MINKNQSGRTMMEMLGVLAIIGVITYGAISGINSGMTSYKINQTYIEVSNIISGMQDIYLSVFGRNNFPYDLTCDANHSNTPGCRTLKKEGILSKNAKDLTINLQNDGELEVTYTAKNSEICNRLKVMDWDIQSINCFTDTMHHDKCSSPNNDCRNDNKLYFLPK